MKIPWLVLTFAAFLGLKLSGAVDWSWWAVTSPLLLEGFLLLVATVVAVFLIRGARKLERQLTSYSRSARSKGIV